VVIAIHEYGKVKPMRSSLWLSYCSLPVSAVATSGVMMQLNVYTKHESIAEYLRLQFSTIGQEPREHPIDGEPSRQSLFLHSTVP
jgi:hypothetical protein